MLRVTLLRNVIESDPQRRASREHSSHTTLHWEVAPDTKNKTQPTEPSEWHERPFPLPSCCAWRVVWPITAPLSPYDRPPDDDAKRTSLTPTTFLSPPPFNLIRPKLNIVSAVWGPHEMRPFPAIRNSKLVKPRPHDQTFLLENLWIGKAKRKLPPSMTWLQKLMRDNFAFSEPFSLTDNISTCVVNNQYSVKS